MGQAASIVTYTVDSANSEELHQRVSEHLIPAARKCAGYRGFLLIDLGDGKRLALLFFNSPQQVSAAQAILTPVGQQHTYGLMSGPAVGSLGIVLLADGLFLD